MKTILLNGNIINENRIFKAHLVLADKKIESIIEESDPNFQAYQEKAPSNHQVYDLVGKYVLPGLIDDQVHFREPGLTHKANIFSESRAAVAGGVTSFMDMPNTSPPTLSQELLEQKNEIAAQNSLANYTFFMGCSEHNLNEVLKTDPHKTCGIKVFLGSSTGDMLVESRPYLKDLFKNAPTIIAAHCEEEAVIKRNTLLIKEQYGDNPPMRVHPIIRSDQACFESSQKAANLARETGARLHILHLSTAKELELLDRDMDLEDKKITGEICVHHIWFTDQDYDRLGWRIKWNPAIKSMENRDALRLALKKGWVDVLATDHAPHTFKEKQQPYFSCPSGGPLIQHSLLAMLDLVKQGVYSLEEVVQFTAHKPARLFKVHKRGFIREGYYADLCVVDLNASFKVEHDNILSLCKWSPFEDYEFASKVLFTFVNANLVYDSQEGIIEGSRGERLLFN